MYIRNLILLFLFPFFCFVMYTIYFICRRSLVGSEVYCFAECILRKDCQEWWIFMKVVEDRERLLFSSDYALLLSLRSIKLMLSYCSIGRRLCLFMCSLFIADEFVDTEWPLYTTPPLLTTQYIDDKIRSIHSADLIFN